MKAPWARWVGAAIAAVWLAVTVYYACRSLPAGMRLGEPLRSAVPTRDLIFLDDITGADAYGRGFSSHTIFDAMLRAISEARSLVVLDCHWCSDLQRSAPDTVAGLTPMAAQLVAASWPARRRSRGCRCWSSPIR